MPYSTTVRDFLYILLGLIIASSTAAEERVNLVRSFQPSPDGNHLTFVSEWQHDGDRDFTLTILTNKQNDEYTLVYSLTPRIREIVLAPDNHLMAYIAQDFYHWMGIYLWKDGRVIGLDYSETRSVIEKLQFSQDQQYLRYYKRPSMGMGKHFGDWVIITMRGARVTSEAEQESIHWQPPIQPETLPRFFTDAFPAVYADTRVQWAPNSQSFYLADTKGLWRCKIGPPFVSTWTQLVNDTNVIGFQLSPEGSHIVYETGDDSQAEHQILLLNLEQSVARTLGKGWSPAFSMNGQWVFYGNFTGFHRAGLDGSERILRHATYRP